MKALPSTPRILGGAIVRIRYLVLSWIAGMAIFAGPQSAQAWIRLQTQSGECWQTLLVGPANLYVLYEPGFAPPGPASISAAEFRLDMGSPPGVFMTFIANPAAIDVIGDVTQGIRIEFSDCQASPLVLGTLQMFVFQPLLPQSWFVRGGGPGSGICPLVRTCAPENAWLPVRGSEFKVNPTTYWECFGTFCETIAVEPSTWAAIKSVYR